MTVWFYSLSGSCDKEKPLYPPYHNVYDHLNSLNADLPLEATTHEVKWPFNHVVWLERSSDKYKSLHLLYRTFDGHQAWQVITYNVELRNIKLDDPSLFWSFEFKWWIKYIMSPLKLNHRLLNMGKWEFTVRGYHSLHWPIKLWSRDLIAKH